MSEEARSISHIIPVQREAISTLRNGKFDRALSAQQDSIQTFSNSIAQKYRGQRLRGESFMCMPAISRFKIPTPVSFTDRFASTYSTPPIYIPPMAMSTCIEPDYTRRLGLTLVTPLYLGSHVTNSVHCVSCPSLSPVFLTGYYDVVHDVIDLHSACRTDAPGL